MITLPLLLVLLAEPHLPPGSRPPPPEPSHAEQIAASENAILSEPAPTGAPAARNPWDFKSAPQYLDLVTARFPLDERERSQLFANGFVVAGRFRQQTFNASLHEIHTSQLPVFISTDAILQAVFRSHDRFLSNLEYTTLAPRLVALVRKLQQALPKAAASLPKQTVQDLEFYLRMARVLAVDPDIAASPTDAPWLAKISRAQGVETMTLFGRKRRVDFSQFKPRGHYADEREGLGNYFKLVMWLSRIELNLKSNACASSHPGPEVMTEETPREVLMALALADLAERAGAMGDLDAVDRAFATLAGRREDVSLSQLASLRKEAGVSSLTSPDAAAKVTAAIADRFGREVNFHPMPPNQKVRPLPVIATLLGPRITSDAAAIGALTGELDPLAWAAVLGHDRAFEHFSSTKELNETVVSARGRLGSTHFGDDLYSTWLRALVAHGTAPRGIQPSFADKPAWADFRVNTAIVGYAQLRHNNLLYSAEISEEGGCQIPDGWVEPNPETYEALAEHARRGLAATTTLEQQLGGDFTTAKTHFTRLEKIMKVLAALSVQELANRPLSAEGKRWLSMVAEAWSIRETYVRTWSAKHDGWYFDLFFGSGGGLVDQAASEFIADLHSQTHKTAYAGARKPELGFFVVDTGGPPRLMVGPVARGFTVWGDRKTRWTDSSVSDDIADARFNAAPWMTSYRPAVGERRLYLADKETYWTATRLMSVTPGMDGPGSVVLHEKPVAGPVTFRLRGEHGEELLATTVTAKPPRFVIPPELLPKARLLSAEADGEVVESAIHFERW